MHYIMIPVCTNAVNTIHHKFKRSFECLDPTSQLGPLYNASTWTDVCERLLELPGWRSTDACRQHGRSTRQPVLGV